MSLVSLLNEERAEREKGEKERGRKTRNGEREKGLGGIERLREGGRERPENDRIETETTVVR